MPCDVLLINPPFITLTSRVGVGHQVPLGLLMVGGALLDAGFRVKLLDAEVGRLSVEEVVAEVRQLGPRIVMTGHAGSTPAHPTCVAMLRAIKRAMPEVVTVYGGPYPTYHAREILRAEACVDVIVRGEGEATGVALVRAILAGGPLGEVESIAFRPARGNSWHPEGCTTSQPEGCTTSHAEACTTNHAETCTTNVTREREPLKLDDYRIGWELLDENDSWDRYQCFGLGRAVIMQFSRGCPHHCTYCGQRGFWMQWRHREPMGLVDEIEWLVQKRGVRFITLADENPTTLREPWKVFLQELARRELPVKFFATIRATDIVRDAELMPLYHAGGIQYVLMGIETTDPATLKAIRKGSTTRVDYRACRLLQENGIYAMIGQIVGLGNERWRGFVHAARQLRLYDGHYLNMMYATPHAWTEFARASRGRRVIDGDLRHWDYRHQILGEARMRPWEIFAAVKMLEIYFHLRPRRLLRLLTAGAFSRQQFWWGTWHTGLVWLGEIAAFLRQPRRSAGTLETMSKEPLGECRHEERVRVSISAPGVRVAPLDRVREPGVV